MTFEQDVQEYANKAHANAWRIALKPDEPALVSSFLSRSMYRGLRDVIQNHVTPSTAVMVRGIFTHQTPKVLLQSRSQSCEIADLMLVRQHFYPSRRNRTTGHALLLQAKKCPQPQTGSVAGGTQECQFELYRDWSPFEGTTRLPKGPPGSNSWDFRQGGLITQATAATCSEYLTVFDKHAFSTVAANPQWRASVVKGPAFPQLAGNYPQNCTWSAGGCPTPTSSASAGVMCLDDFGTVFREFFNGRRGRSFTSGISSGADHWSIFVNMMLQISARPNGDYVYTSKNQGVIAGMRGRNLAFAEAIPSLLHSIDDEVDAFLENPGSTFDMTNRMLKLVRSRLHGQRQNLEEHPQRPAPPDSIDMPEQPSLGHIPLLLVTTVGEEPPTV
ncbi:hypothetical protein ASE39_22600 [Acidovorax sp. Root267]|uniref:hypothetical protein n=1 Tax=Acidovorax sp. Root267 TaxID=1736505 RepID=UPI00070C945E|nr:hypothetical protein [Acidovorax sp. Root267]KRD25364.1 hypothetical protein ASE39_22600 [Acidovorax sp. Root267]